MGVSTNAIIFYGIDLDSEDPDIEDIVYDSEKGEYIDSEFVGIDMHCSCSYPMYYVYIKESQIVASRGYPVILDKKPIMPDLPRVYAKIEWGEWNTLIEAFCKEHNLPYKEPQWLLCSMWDQ